MSYIKFKILLWKHIVKVNNFDAVNSNQSSISDDTLFPWKLNVKPFPSKINLKPDLKTGFQDQIFRECKS